MGLSISNISESSLFINSKDLYGFKRNTGADKAAE
jgi:hypothetical protein